MDGPNWMGVKPEAALLEKPVAKWGQTRSWLVTRRGSRRSHLPAGATWADGANNVSWTRLERRPLMPTLSAMSTIELHAPSRRGLGFLQAWVQQRRASFHARVRLTQQRWSAAPCRTCYGGRTHGARNINVLRLFDEGPRCCRIGEGAEGAQHTLRAPLWS